MTNAVSGGGGQTLAMATRPLTGTMFYLAQGIEVPNQDLERSFVTITQDPDGKLLDWKPIIKGLMPIGSATNRQRILL